ncbi:hypothetical protein GUJ93_ZPchr0007g5034 [Zizania palustris]|uniref:Uncharacterized protein n=1 Tax=Zizania palustris TaxID=103762 RepID=A0A8J5W007_ZIZPA|nr:hypothetical protein GUJ93_ZPchr0007g5034 [Zizania palustris]
MQNCINLLDRINLQIVLATLTLPSAQQFNISSMQLALALPLLDCERWRDGDVFHVMRWAPSFCCISASACGNIPPPNLENAVDEDEIFECTDTSAITTILSFYLESVRNMEAADGSSIHGLISLWHVDTLLLSFSTRRCIFKDEKVCASAVQCRNTGDQLIDERMSKQL